MTKTSLAFASGVRGMRRALLGATSAVALIAGVFGGATNASAETLADALVLAISNNPQYDAAVAGLQSLDESVAQARSGQRPTVTLGADASAQGRAGSGVRTVSAGEQDISDAEAVYSAGADLTVRQNLFDGGQTLNAIDSATADVRSARRSLIDTEQDVLLQAVTAYVQVLQSQENVGLAQNNVSVILQELDAARDRFDVGEVTRTDVAQAEARLAESEANLTRAQGILGAARQSYRRAVSVPPTGLAPLPPLPELPSTLEEAQAIAERNHPSIEAARESVTAASFTVRQQQGALLPSVDAVGSLTVDQTSRDTNSDSSVYAATVGVQATLDLYRGGVLRSGIRQAQALASQSRAQLYDTTRLVLEDVGLAWEDLATARAEIVANLQQIRANEVAFEGVQEEAKVGSRTTLDVLDAEQELLDARVALVNSRSDEYIAGYTLLSSIGLLTVNHLGLDVDTYNPAPGYEAVQGADVGYPETEDTEWRYNFRP